MMGKLIPKPLGNTGLSVSSLGIGTVKWGRTEGLKHGDFKLPDDQTCEALLNMALDAGVNVLDTAPAYGFAEERLGKLLGARRDKFHLFTKTGEVFRNSLSSWDFSAEHTRSSVEQSLHNLRTDRLDAVLLHCPREDLEIIRNTPALETLMELKKEGLIRAVGISTMSLEGGLAAVPLCDLVMVAWNPDFKEHQPVIEAAAAAGKGVLLKKVFSSGNLPAIGAMNPVEYCVESALGLPGNPVVIAGTISLIHLKENIRAASPGPLNV